MKIWVTEIGEPLPFEKDVRLHRYGMFTQALAARGHDVTWWTSTFSHAIKRHVFDGDREESFHGVRIRFIDGPGYRKNVSLARIQHQRRFAERFLTEASNAPAPDLLISPIPTLEAAEIATRFARERNIPLVTDIRDEWPEEFVDLTPKPLRPLARLALIPAFNRLKYVCRNADGIIAMSRRQLDYGLRYSDRGQGENDGVFPHGYSAQPVDPSKVRAAREWWVAQGVRETSFVACFFGTIGRFFALETVIEAARILEGEQLDFQFVLCGDGSGLDKYRKMARGLSSVIFPGWVDAPRIAALMELAQAGLAPYRAGTRMSLPGKPFEYFAGSLPVISSIEGELTEVLAKNDCGISYPAQSGEALASALKLLYFDRERARQMGRNSRRLLDREYATEIIFEKLNRHLIGIAERRGRGEADTQERTAAIYSRYAAARPAERDDLLTNPEVMFQLLAGRRALIEALRRVPRDARILDVGGGGGSELSLLLDLGYAPERLSMVDILPERVAAARRRFPSTEIECADAQALPWAEGAFDVVIEGTMFLQITDDTVARRIAQEMLRVAGPEGTLLLADWRYDGWREGFRAVDRRRVARLFDTETGRCTIERVVLGALLPPLGRAFSAWLPSLYFLVQRLFPFAVGHVVYVLKKNP